jgi:hypothetical protein
VDVNVCRLALPRQRRNRFHPAIGETVSVHRSPSSNLEGDRADTRATAAAAASGSQKSSENKNSIYF